jgi:hypothetical protein
VSPQLSSSILLDRQLSLPEQIDSEPDELILPADDVIFTPTVSLSDPAALRIAHTRPTRDRCLIRRKLL